MASSYTLPRPSLHDVARTQPGRFLRDETFRSGGAVALSVLLVQALAGRTFAHPGRIALGALAIGFVAAMIDWRRASTAGASATAPGAV